MTKPHWLGTTKSNYSPDAIVCFDTETTWSLDGQDEVHTLRCWDAKLTLRHSRRPHLSRIHYGKGTTAPELLAFLEWCAHVAGDIVVFAHNVSFDLAVTALPVLLCDSGWTVTGWSLQQQSAWLVAKRDGETITLSDSWSWLTCSLEAAAKDLGKRKVPLPANDGSLANWHKRCRSDVDLLDLLIVQILDWWDVQAIGRWGITGSSCGWAAMRRMVGPKAAVVGPEPGRTAFERRALYGGRQEVYLVGQQTNTWVANWDFHCAYLRTMAGHAMPKCEERVWSDPAIGELDLAAGDRVIIAEVIVTTEAPVAPVKMASGIWWPVGTFRTVLPTPEILYARGQGAKVELVYGHTYRADYWLREFAIWVLGLLDPREQGVPAPVRRMAKGWARSVPGRFAKYSARTLYRRKVGGDGWDFSSGTISGTYRPVDVLTLGGWEEAIAYDQDAADCSPAVLAVIESHCRVALARMLDTRPQNQLLTCNTDGWWESGSLASNKATVPDVPYPMEVRRKVLSRNVTVAGPGHVHNCVWRRMSGVPAAAEEVGERSYAYRAWPGLRAQLGGGHTGQYRRPPATVALQEHYARRWVLASGETVPVAVAIGPTPVPVILPWADTPGRREGDVLADHQDALLEPLRGDRECPPVIFPGRDWGARGRLDGAVRARRVRAGGR